jgi:hypothetical protein
MPESDCWHFEVVGGIARILRWKLRRRPQNIAIAQRHSFLHAVSLSSFIITHIYSTLTFPSIKKSQARYQQMREASTA